MKKSKPDYAVFKSLNISLEDWFETALIESEYVALTNLLSNNTEDQPEWKWDDNFCRFVLYEVMRLND